MRKAFTILELLVVILIIAVFSTLTLPYFHTTTNEKALESETKRIEDVIELAKSKAAASEGNIPGCFIFRGYRVYFDNPPTQYRLRACCSSAAAPTQLCSFSQDLQIYTVLPGVNLTFSANLAVPNNYIHFPVLKLGTLLANNAVIKVTVPALNKCIPITVNRLGLVTEGAKQAPPC